MTYLAVVRGGEAFAIVAGLALAAYVWERAGKKIK